MSIMRGEATPPSQVVPTVGPAMDSFFQRAFAKKPEGRFETGLEMADAFARALQAIPIELKDGPLAGRARLDCRSSAWGSGPRRAPATATAEAAAEPEPTRTLPVASRAPSAGLSPRSIGLALVGGIALGLLLALLWFRR
jgi:hypothetical protein